MARPREEKTAAILDALQAMIAEGKRPTMLELAHRAKVSSRDAKSTVANLVRAGHVEVKESRRVHYRNKPVAEYGFPEMSQEVAPVQALNQVLNAWRT